MKDNFVRRVLSISDEHRKLDSALDVEHLVQAIENMDTMYGLELKGNSIGAQAGKHIARALECHPELKYAYWSDIFTGRLLEEIPSVLLHFCESMLKVDINLVELDLSHNAFGPVCAKALESYLENAATLQVLRLENNGLGSRGGSVIADALLKCCVNAERSGGKFCLKTLIAGRNRLESAGATSFAAFFERVGSLEEINLYQNGITAPGIELLARSFRFNSALKIIDLRDNTFTESGAKEFATAIRYLSNIEVLTLGDCLCRDRGVSAILNAINPTQHRFLKVIDLSGNELGVSMVDMALSKFTRDFQLERIVCHTNNLGSSFGTMKQRWAPYFNVEFGDSDDDQGSAEDGEDEHEEYSSDDNHSENRDEANPADDEFRSMINNTKTCTVTDAEIADILEKCSLESSSSKKDVLLSFRGQQNKWNTAHNVVSVRLALLQTKQVHVLELTGNSLGIEAGASIAEALQMHPEFKKALWSDLFTGRLRQEIPPILRSLCSAMIRSGCQLVELDLSDNAFGPVGADGIKDFLQVAFALQVLKLNNNGLGAGAAIVANALRKCTIDARSAGKNFRLKVFICGRNRLEESGAIALSQFFSMIDSLEEVDLHQNGINAAGVIALSNSLKFNTELRTIDLSDNTFTRTGALAFAEAVPFLQKIEVLNLSDCLCRNSGAISILAALSSNVHQDLKVVNFSGNELTRGIVETVIRTFNSSGFHLESLVLHTNNIGSSFNKLIVSYDKNKFISLGTESDDQGSLDEDDLDDHNDKNSNMNRMSSRSSTERHSCSSFEATSIEKMITEFIEHPRYPAVQELCVRKEDVVHFMKNDVMERNVEKTAALLYALCSLITKKALIDWHFISASKGIADSILAELNSIPQWPSSAIEQVCMELLAYGKAERAMNGGKFSSNITGLTHLFRSQIVHFRPLMPTIKFYFSEYIRGSHPSMADEIDCFLKSI